MFSRIVGPAGRVYAVWPQAYAKLVEGNVAKLRGLSASPHYANVVAEVQPTTELAAPEPLDLVWTSQNYHDYADKFMGVPGPETLARAAFRLLEPGGIFMVIDHAAAPGRGMAATDTLHRIDRRTVIEQARAAGFELAGESRALANPADPLTVKSSIRRSAATPASSRSSSGSRAARGDDLTSPHRANERWLTQAWCYQRSWNAVERPGHRFACALDGDYHASMQTASDGAPGQARARRTLTIFIILFWIAQFSVLTAQRFALNPGENRTMLVPRACVTLFGIGLSFLIVRLQGRTRGRSIGVRTAAAAAMAVVASLLHAADNMTMFWLFFPEEFTADWNLMGYVESLVQWFWSYAALSGMIYALLSSFDVQDRERQIGQLQRIAHEAQLRALRYQLNPHFMFNTLNSITALIAGGNPRDAEAMVENLADFLRAGLSLDPLDDIALSREIELQSLYLAIEIVRFPDRLRVVMDVSPEAADALVPSLVTQPLIENVIRHAVVHATARVELVIAAHREDDELVVSVVNDTAERVGAQRRGTGVGLANVEERLRARFGQAVRFAAGPRADGKYEAGFAVPYVREAWP